MENLKKKEKPRVSIVIITKNQKGYLEKALPMISKQTLKKTGVIVADSGSTDGALEVMKKYPVKIVPIRPEEFSYAKAANLGISLPGRDHCKAQWGCCSLQSFLVEKLNLSF